MMLGFTLVFNTELLNLPGHAFYLLCHGCVSIFIKCDFVVLKSNE